MAKFIVGDKLLRALYDAGAVESKPRSTRRVVIDLQYGSVGRIYVETFADDEKLGVALAAGLEIVGTEAEAGLTTGKTLSA